MVVNRTYFAGPLVIPNLNQPAISDVVDTYILLHGEEMLSKAMGESLKDAYLEGIEEVTIEERWANLKDGCTFTNQSGYSRKWVGFDSGESIPLNPVACYVWFHYQRDINQQISGVGTVQANPENAVNVSQSQKLSLIWNQMCKDVYVLWEYLQANASDYEEWDQGEINPHFFNKINGFGI